MIVLGVETSCDETAVAIVENGKTILSDVVYTQIKIHEKYGGVVPEVASRRHVQKILTVFEEALTKSNLTPEAIDYVAVTATPGLIGSLLVGLNAARSFAFAHDIPCLDINHLHGHIYANYIESDFHFPLVALIVSGGHTELILMRDHYEFELLGQTLDDAVGEAYDKVGRVMGLTYPAGPKVDRLAQIGQHNYSLPLTYLDKNGYEEGFNMIENDVTREMIIDLINEAIKQGVSKVKCMAKLKKVYNLPAAELSDMWVKCQGEYMTDIIDAVKNIEEPKIISDLEKAKKIMLEYIRNGETQADCIGMINKEFKFGANMILDLWNECMKQPESIFKCTSTDVKNNLKVIG
ncbi:MAG: tRNA (adenosine(37)-N6)-threonylcarbamoyltransferase complex transferase subunit TsaD, partial [Bacilli bacterium]